MPIASQEYIRGMASTNMMLIIAYQYYTSHKLDDEEGGEEEEMNKDKRENFIGQYLFSIYSVPVIPLSHLCVVSPYAVGRCGGGEEMAGGDMAWKKRL